MDLFEGMVRILKLISNNVCILNDERFAWQGVSLAVANKRIVSFYSGLLFSLTIPCQIIKLNSKTQISRKGKSYPAKEQKTVAMAVLHTYTLLSIICNLCML